MRFLAVLAAIGFLFASATASASAGRDPQAVADAIAATLKKYAGSAPALTEADRKLACEALRADIKALASLARLAEANAARLAIEPLAANVTAFLVAECKDNTTMTCRSSEESIVLDVRYLLDAGLLEPGGPRPEEIETWYGAVSKLCGHYRIEFATKTAGQHVDAAGCIQPISMDVSVTTQLGAFDFERIEGKLFLAAYGEGQHAIASYKHSIHTCGEGDNISPISATSSKPMKFRVRLDALRIDPENYQLSRAFFVDIDPGRIEMTWRVCNDGCLVAVYEWWHEMFGSHYGDRVQGDGLFGFSTGAGASSQSIASGVFSGAGSYRDFGTWTGTDRTEIVIRRAD